MPWSQKEPLGLMAYPDQIGQDWRHFEWTFKTPADIDANTAFRVYTQSERAIEVRGLDFRESHWDRPREYPYQQAPLGAGGRLYALRAELAPRRPGDPPVAIYENRGIKYWPRVMPTDGISSKDIEHAKWQIYIPPGDWPRLGIYECQLDPLPAIGVKLDCRPTVMLFGTSAGGILYVIVLAAVGFAAAARRRE
jgi:hypothetical protein